MTLVVWMQEVVWPTTVLARKSTIPEFSYEAVLTEISYAIITYNLSLQLPILGVFPDTEIKAHCQDSKDCQHHFL